jgi:hypothetical protein
VSLWDLSGIYAFSAAFCGICGINRGVGARFGSVYQLATINLQLATDFPRVTWA